MNDALDKAERDITGVFDLARRFVRAIDHLTSPDEPPPPPVQARVVVRKQPAEQATVEARVVRRKDGGSEIVVAEPTAPAKRNRP